MRKIFCFILMLFILIPIFSEQLDYYYIPVELEVTPDPVRYGFSSSKVNSIFEPKDSIDNSSTNPLVFKYDLSTNQYYTDIFFFYVQAFTTRPITVTISEADPFNDGSDNTVHYYTRNMDFPSKESFTGSENFSEGVVVINESKLYAGTDIYKYPRVYSFSGSFYVEGNDVKPGTTYTTSIQITIEDSQ